MKRIAYFFLLIALLSCGTHVPQSGSRIKVQIRDSTIQDLYLISVRNAALVVSPNNGFASSYDTLMAHAFVLPFEKIETIVYQGEESYSVLPGIGGGVLGVAAGCVAGGYAMKQEGDFMLLIGGGTIGGFFGCIGGSVIARAMSHPDEKYIFDIKNHFEELREVAIFPDNEPTRLQNIK